MSRQDVVLLIKTFNNTKVREGQKISNTSKHSQDLIKYVDVKMQKNIDSVKTQKAKDAKKKVKDDLISFLSSNKGNLKIIFDIKKKST